MNILVMPFKLLEERFVISRKYFSSELATLMSQGECLLQKGVATITREVSVF